MDHAANSLDHAANSLDHAANSLDHAANSLSLPISLLQITVAAARHPQRYLLFRFPKQYVPLLTAMYATCPAYLKLYDLSRVKQSVGMQNAKLLNMRCAAVTEYAVCCCY